MMPEGMVWKMNFGGVGDDRVAGVGPTLIAHHHIGGGREIIDDLGLAFVAPLRS